ncbi:MAG TPA: hypothetical protein VLR49_14660 [Ferruginibacter sp.]|nr:hypothetical protein [Ferruginibacter sp.]
MNINILRINFLAIIIAVLFTACQKDKIGEGNDEELITTMNLKFTPVNGGAPVNYSFIDLDGPGGIIATQDEIVLSAATSYNVEVELLNSSANPVENITEEVEEEGESHRFYYEPTAGISISDLNIDSLGTPLGITSKWTTSTAGPGAVKITLRHYIGTPPDKQNPDPVNSPKSVTDIELTFITRTL